MKLESIILITITLKALNISLKDSIVAFVLQLSKRFKISRQTGRHKAPEIVF
jgi:hypothetical protein